MDASCEIWFASHWINIHVKWLVNRLFFSIIIFKINLTDSLHKQNAINRCVKKFSEKEKKTKCATTNVLTNRYWTNEQNDQSVFIDIVLGAVWRISQNIFFTLWHSMQFAWMNWICARVIVCKVSTKYLTELSIHTHEHTTIYVYL